MIVATHDVEFAATFAERVLLLADGRLIADASAGEVLCGGWYFTTETARILDGAERPCCPRTGRPSIQRRIDRAGASSPSAIAPPGPPRGAQMSWQAASLAIVRRLVGGVLLVV